MVDDGFTTLFFSTLARADVGPGQSLMSCFLVGRLRIAEPREMESTSTVGVDYERSFVVGSSPAVWILQEPEALE